MILRFSVEYDTREVWWQRFSALKFPCCQGQLASFPRVTFRVLTSFKDAISFPESSFPWPAVGKERLWWNPKRAIFDWLLKNGFISCHFQSLNSKIVLSSGFLSTRGSRWSRNKSFYNLPFRNVFVFDNKSNFHLRDTRCWNLFWLIKCISLLFILRSLKVSSLLGDVFILMCTVSRGKSKRCLPSRTRSYLTGTRVFWFRFWIIPEPPAPVLLDKGNGGSANEIVKDGAYYCYCAYVLRSSRYSDFLWVVLINTGILLRGLNYAQKAELSKCS